MYKFIFQYILRVYRVQSDENNHRTFFGTLTLKHARTLSATHALGAASLCIRGALWGVVFVVGVVVCT